MNSAFVVDQAKHLANRAKTEVEKDDLSGAVVRCFELLFGQNPDNEELASAIAVIKNEIHCLSGPNQFQRVCLSSMIKILS